MFQNPPTYNVKIRDLHGDAELIQTDDIQTKVKDLENSFRREGFDVVIRNLMDVRDGMRDPM